MVKPQDGTDQGQGEEDLQVPALENGFFYISRSQVTGRSERIRIRSIKIALRIRPYFFPLFPILAFLSHRSHLLIRKYSHIDYCMFRNPAKRFVLKKFLVRSPILGIFREPVLPEISGYGEKTIKNISGFQQNFRSIVS
jgi:hypothetical protein